MRYENPIGIPFEIDDEWLAAVGAASPPAKARHFVVADQDVVLAALSEVKPPLRTAGQIWFRDRGSVVRLLTAMVEGTPLPPIEVWSKGLKAAEQHVVRDGFHRYHLSIALGFDLLPLVIKDFDYDEFFAAEARGLG